ncbi:MAG: 2TM domain-containing protein [Alphaproteobacteria bacterium]|nr:2TM domain-containing protein [Alphaproteobacteria bacterium]
MNSPDRAAERARRRLRGFVWHLIGYFAAMLVIVPVNLILTPETVWFVLPMVGWGGVLAIHVAYAMGLFDIFAKGG